MAAAGDQTAFRSLYDATSAKLYSTILRLLDDRSETEDLLQEVYAKIWRTAGSYDTLRGRPMTWLITIARHRAIDRLRTRSVRLTVKQEHLAEAVDPAPAADVLFSQSQDGRLLDRALATLVPAHAAAIKSIYFDGITYDTLAAQNGVPVGTLKSWMHRGLVRMRAELIEHDSPKPI